MISVDEEMAGSLKDYGDRYGVGDDSLQVRFTENPGVSVSIEAADLSGVVSSPTQPSSGYLGGHGPGCAGQSLCSLPLYSHNPAAQS